MSIMGFLVVIFLFIVTVSVLNEKRIHLQGDIALLLFSTFCSGLLLILAKIPGLTFLEPVLHRVGDFGFEEYLMDFVLCFMLFAGASKVNMGKFRQNLRAISLLALLTTVLSSAFYGLLFWAAGLLFGVRLDIWVCILLGCIVSPTDPIAATGILNKLGLSKNVTSVIESESLFNDGTGVALFVFVKSIVSTQGAAYAGQSVANGILSGGGSFLSVMLKEVVGALVVALAVSFVLFWLLERTRDPSKHIMISLLDVAMVYLICEYFGFSGVIASVVCGMYFAYRMHRISRRRMVDDPEDRYGSFWEVADTLLNSILFVMIGISLLDIRWSDKLPFIVVAGIVCVIVSRFCGVWMATVLAGKKKIPSSYSRTEFVTLMTWSALKGGLSLALAMSTREFLDEEVYQIILNTTFLTILFTVIVQGLTVPIGYRRIERHKANRIQAAACKNRNVERHGSRG